MSTKSSRSQLFKNIFIKVLIILITGFVYTIVVASGNFRNQSNGVCVFDIDFTLNCKGAYAAVEVCKNAGFDLAINTARNKNDAMQILSNGMLIEKGFDPYFVEMAKNQQGLEGPFQYKENWAINQPMEQLVQSKSYGMRKIANYYNFKTDDNESRNIILFDDFMHNIIQMQPNKLDPYGNSSCKKDENGLCYIDPKSSPDNVSYPRNWKIYRSKWVGYFCTRWNNPNKAAKDAEEAVFSVIYNSERKLAEPID